MPIRPSPADQTTALRIPGPSPAPTESYWRKLEADAAGYMARTIRVEEPSLAAPLDEAAAKGLRQAFDRMRALLPNTRIVLGTDGGFSRGAVPTAVRLPVDALILDTVARPHLLVEALALAPAGLELLVPEVGR